MTYKQALHLYITDDSSARQPLTSILLVTAAEIKTVRSLTSIEINYG